MVSSTTSKPARVLTVGRIASLTGEPIHRIQYILKTRPYIRPVATAGRLRVFDQRGLDLIRRELGRVPQ